MEYVDIRRARIKFPDGSVRTNVRVVFSSGQLAIWEQARAPDGTKLDRRNRYAIRTDYLSSVTFHQAFAGKNWHKAVVNEEEWIIQQLPPGGCGCEKVAPGHTAPQLLEPTFASTGR